MENYQTCNKKYVYLLQIRNAAHKVELYVASWKYWVITAIFHYYVGVIRIASIADVIQGSIWDTLFIIVLLERNKKYYDDHLLQRIIIYGNIMLCTVNGVM